jgi:hypothetical protein
MGSEILRLARRIIPQPPGGHRFYRTLIDLVEQFNLIARIHRAYTDRDGDLSARLYGALWGERVGRSIP